MDDIRRRLVGAAEIRSDMAALRSVVELMFEAGDTRRRALEWIDRYDTPMFARLAPYAVSSILDGLADFHVRFGVCSRARNALRDCAPYFAPPPPPRAAATYTIAHQTSGILTLTIHDLSDASNSGWGGFAMDMPQLTGARGLVVDMRQAVGSDPRPLLAWLETVTGRHPLAPLREIRRPAALEPYVEAYRQRFLVETRDRSVWEALVGTPAAPSSSPQPPPMVVVVGRHCHSACELVARVLETYAGATVIGGVNPHTGRLVRDEPALMRMDAAGIDAYFFASEYFLSADIEAATGPTGQWRSPSGHDRSVDLLTAALQLVQRRAAPNARQWPPRCDEYRAFPNRAAMPAAARSRLSGEHALGSTGCSSPAAPGIWLRSSLPHSLLQQLVGTCPTPYASPLGVTHNDSNVFFVGSVHRGREGMDIVTRLAQNPAIDHIYVRCSHPPQLD